MASFIGSTLISSCFGSQYPRAVVISQRPISKITLHKPVQRIAASSQHTNSTQLSDSTNVRRSGNYKPSIWDDNYLQSLNSNYTGDACRKRAEKLSGEVRKLISTVAKPLDQLELIDTLQRLGLGYHFDNEIKNILQTLYNNSNDMSWKKGNLYATSLEFRLLRQHGFHVSQEIFNDFKDEIGSFNPGLCQNIKAMLNFYEASYYGLEEENILEEAWEFTTKHLKDLDRDDVEQNLAVEVKRALDLPLHWLPPRVVARLFIDLYEKREDMNPLLLELAKLDFNIVQGIHQDDLKDLSRWWKNIGLGTKLSFARNRLVTSFLWSIGIAFEPQYSFCRKMLAKAISLINVIDDIYDVYGNLSELELLTDAYESWDLMKAMEKLPNYMKIAYFAHYNYINDMAFDILKEQEIDVLQTLRDEWTTLARVYFKEAKWYHSRHIPTLEEYLQNAWVSVAGPIVSITAFLSGTNPIQSKELEFLESNPDVLYWGSTAFRLQEDLGTSPDEMKRGDVPKAIQCYMHETDASEKAAREHIKHLMRQIWKKLNALRVAENNPLSQTTVEYILNLLRTSHFVYLHGDGHGVEDQDMVSSFLFQPIPLQGE